MCPFMQPTITALNEAFPTVTALVWLLSCEKKHYINKAGYS